MMSIEKSYDYKVLISGIKKESNIKRLFSKEFIIMKKFVEEYKDIVATNESMM